MRPSLSPARSPPPSPRGSGQGFGKAEREEPLRARCRRRQKNSGKSCREPRQPSGRLRDGLPAPPTFPQPDGGAGANKAGLGAAAGRAAGGRPGPGRGRAGGEQGARGKRPQAQPGPALPTTHLESLERLAGRQARAAAGQEFGRKREGFYFPWSLKRGSEECEE